MSVVMACRACGQLFDKLGLQGGICRDCQRARDRQRNRRRNWYRGSWPSLSRRPSHSSQSRKAAGVTSARSVMPASAVKRRRWQECSRNCGG